MAWYVSHFSYVSTETRHRDNVLNPRERKVVLIVDDSVTALAFLRRVLTEQEFAVLEAANGMDALSILSTDQRIELVLTDLYMPALDGISLLRKIRSAPTRRLVPVIVQTCEAQGSVIDIGKEAGATAWLTKPISEQRLLLVIQRTLAHRA
jgi:two-component system, chemotaxis family, chemotaxis protein CheY